MKRPTGITVLAIAAIIYGIFNLLIALLGVLGEAIKASGLAPAAVKYSAGTLAYATISDAILGIVLLVFGIGALGLKRWAWTTGVAALVLEVARQIIGIVIQGITAVAIVRDGITILIALLLLWYLFRPPVRDAFGAAA